MCSVFVLGSYMLPKLEFVTFQSQTIYQNFVHYQLWHAYLQAARLVNFFGLEIKVARASAALCFVSGRLPGLFVL